MNYIMFREELISISEYTGISFDKLLLMQLCYEMCSMCTSVGTKLCDKNIHFRTMDWSMDFLKEITVQLKFVKENKQIFEATSWVGYLGILTGLSYNNYSIALNFRKSDGTIYDNFKRVLNLCYPIGYKIREVLTNQLLFENVVDIMSNNKFISPCYVTIIPIIGDPIIIIRDPSLLVNITRKTPLVQTNIDNIDGQLYGDNILYSKERIYTVENILKEHNNNFQSYDDIITSMNIFPIINDETIYVTIMDPNNNKMMTYINHNN